MPGAQCVVGQAYLNGEGMPKDLTKALQWFRKAAEKGDKAAREELAGLTRKLSPNQLRQGQERAAAFSRQSANKSALVK
jgi:TPR repeat protein